MKARPERKVHYLTNLKNNEKLENKVQDYFIFFDTETEQEECNNVPIGHKNYNIIKNKLKMGWACFWNRKTGEEDWLYFTKIDNFHWWLGKKITETSKASLWLIAHNIEFDAVVLDLWSYFDKYNYKSDFIHSKGMVFIQKFCKKWEYTRVNKKGELVCSSTTKSIMLINNANIIAQKLEAIGKIVNLPKLEIDFDNSSIQAMKIYCKRDVEILLAFWKLWIKFIEENKLGKLKYTISSQAMEAFKKTFCKDIIVLDDDIENLKFERDSYYGGRTEIFYKGIVREKIYYYDVNSMYPHVMKTFRMPTEYKFCRDNADIQEVKELIEKGWLVIAECYINTDERAYPKRDNELLFPVGKFKTYLATPEVIYAMENNHIVKFGRVSFYHGANIFERYVNFMYEKRLEAKAQKSTLENLFKLLLNSLYGKFGQLNDKWVQTQEEEIQAMYPDFNIHEFIMGTYKFIKQVFMGEDITPRLRYLGNELQISEEETESNISFPAIASHVTSYARMLIWKYIKGCLDSGIKVYYCDTDSIFVNKEMPAEFVSQTELGKIKVEKIFENGVQFNGLKNYSSLDKEGNIIVENDKGDKIKFDDVTILNESKIIKGKDWKLKGISNNAMMIDRNTFLQQEWSGLPKQQYFSRFGRQAGEYWIIWVTKKVEAEIKKGKLEESGDITPFNLKEF
jgi:hypothetical protein